MPTPKCLTAKKRFLAFIHVNGNSGYLNLPTCPNNSTTTIQGFDTLEEAKCGLEYTITRQGWATQTVDAYIIDRESNTLAASSVKPVRPLLDWSDAPPPSATSPVQVS